jgi:hypothetical protein
MPHLCCSPAIPCCVNSHMPCRTPGILGQCRLLCESPRGSWKKVNVGRLPTCHLWTADANSHMPCRTPAILRQCRVLHESPCGSWKKLNAGRSPTCRLWTANANSHMPCHAMPMPMPCRVLGKLLSERHGRCMAQTWHDMCESNTAALCKSNGKDTI